MTTIPELRAAITQLEAEIKTLESQGIAQKNYSIDTSTRKGHTYHRLRWQEGEKRVSEVIPEGSVSEWRGLVERRRLWKVKRRELERLQRKLERTVQKVMDLGGTV